MTYRKRAYCSDGKLRMAVIGHADSYFSARARVRVGGRTVTGFIWTDAHGTRCFTADSWRANADALPAWRPSDRGTAVAAA